MSNIGDYPISAPKADEIRDRFTANADAMQVRVDELRAAGNATYADLLQRQVDSWRHMATKRYESMRLVADM